MKNKLFIMESAPSEEQTCKICATKSDFLFKTKVLDKYNVDYYKCLNCGFIQTQNPYWLSEAYNSAISSIDVGLVHRNLFLADKIESVIFSCFDYNQKFLDYGGGYGLLVRIMRDKGFDFYRQDKYCQNLFSLHFDIQDTPNKTKFELVTAFELFEHLENPLKELNDLFNLSDSILFSTELQPNQQIKIVEDWWYFVPEGGQHIALYTQKSLEIMAEKQNVYLYTNGKDTHLLTKKKLNVDPFRIVSIPIIKRSIISRILSKILNVIEKPVPTEEKTRLPSLLQEDFELAKKKKYIIKNKIYETKNPYLPTKPFRK